MIIRADSGVTDPYRNLAMEEYMLRNLRQGQIVMLLWQNHNTVVIGRHQNAWKECDLAAMEADGVNLARRKSGGGAVYHDLGNINFSFLANGANYDVNRQLSVIICAVQSFGVDARFCGRNDITAGDCKFSGNAFYSIGDNRCHHGTILINADITRMGRYLAARDNIKGRGVDSVRSRVVNLSELAPEINVETMKAALLRSFENVYGRKAALAGNMEDTAIDALTAEYACREWVLGKFKDASWSAAERFPWGTVSLELKLQDGIISDTALFTDAVTDKGDCFGDIAKALVGRRFMADDMAAAVTGPFADDLRGLIYKHVSALSS